MEVLGKAFVERLGNTPNHQHVGKNGSFWLPPELKTEAFSKNLKVADSKFDKKNLPKAEVKAKTGHPTQTKHRNPLQGKSDLVSKSDFPSKTNLDSKTQVARNAKPVHNKAFSSKSFSAPTFVLPKRDSLNNQNLLPLIKQSQNSNLRDSGTQSMILKTEVNPDADREVYDNRRNSSHGIKSAYSDHDMEVSFKTQLSLEHVGREITSVSRESNHQARSFFEFAGKEILPRIAYFCKQDKKVVRFAMDLPNGSKLGVRLEKSKNRLNLCFISSDDHSQKMLEQLKRIFDKFSKDDSGSGEFKVFHFQNYKEMDDYFHQAA